ncbi:MAG: YggS family pyridoxal phosphate-dependent enzyme [Bacteroidota bacterium]|jgi:PLP dependent protein
MTIIEKLDLLYHSIPQVVRMIVVSKTQSHENITEAYNAGQRDFGENKVQEMISKAAALPPDIHWHFIGHLQTNKVKYIVPVVYMIHSIDSLKLLKEVDREALKAGRIISCLLQIHIASEETKFGLDPVEAFRLLDSAEYRAMQNVRIRGLMGMATFTDDTNLVRQEFRYLRECFGRIKAEYFQADTSFCELSMGMSGDYSLAIEEGSTMVRIGSAIFGERPKIKPEL